MRLGQLVRVLKRFVFEPCDVELVVAFFDLGDVELAEPAFGAGVAALALTSWIVAVAFLELPEMLFGKRAFFLGDVLIQFSA